MAQTPVRTPVPSQPKSAVAVATQPKSMQFAHFGVLDDGAQSKASTVSAIALNVLLAFVVIVVGAASKKVIEIHKEAELVDPIKIDQVPPEPPKIKIPPPKLPPPPPKVELEPPKIKLPDVKLPDPPKVPQVKMEQPKPIIAPPAPAKVVAPPAPQVVSISKPAPASVPNHDAKPSAVQLGHPDSPVHPTGPAVATPVNVASGFQHMPPGNTGSGNPTKVALPGNGQPNGTAMKGPMGPVAVTGLNNGVKGGTGTGLAGPTAVAINTPQKAVIPAPAAAPVRAGSPPKVSYKPQPQYTAAAKANKISGTVNVSITVSPTGTVTEAAVVGAGLGDGLNESALAVARGTKFQPATDASGQPIQWKGVETVTFQLAE